MTVRPPRERWILALFGPRWGPVPLIWTYVLIVLGAAPLLARLPWAPLKTWHWALLGLGMTQVPVVAPILVALWFMAVGARAKSPPKVWWRFDLVQLGLFLLTIVAMVSLSAALYAGLADVPDMQVSGNGSDSGTLNWFADRVDGTMPRPTVISLPLLVWQLAMLLWALWLAATMVLRWIPWGFRSYLHEGLVAHATAAGTAAESPWPSSCETTLPSPRGRHCLPKPRLQLSPSRAGGRSRPSSRCTSSARSGTRSPSPSWSTW